MHCLVFIESSSCGVQIPRRQGQRIEGRKWPARTCPVILYGGRYTTGFTNRSRVPSSLGTPFADWDVDRISSARRNFFYRPTRTQRTYIARYYLWSGDCRMMVWCIETAERIEMIFSTEVYTLGESYSYSKVTRVSKK